MDTHYSIEITDKNTQKMAPGWLLLGIFSLLMAGLFSLLLVLSRTPFIQDKIPWVDFFHTALVVHVDLSVVIWFMAFAGVFWTVASRYSSIFWDRIILAIASAGTLIIIISPFTGDGNPLLNNYVPVLQQDFFLMGLLVVGVAFALLSLRSLFTASSGTSLKTNQDALLLGIYLSLIAAIISALVFVASAISLPSEDKNAFYYELLFWGGGHAIQFTHTLLLLTGWIWLSQISGLGIKLNTKTTAALLILAFLPTLVAPVIQYLYEITTPEYRVSFTRLMQYGGLTSAPLIIWLIYRVIAGASHNTTQAPLRAALISSILLFSAGGIIGFMIEGVNVVIPAHYHGSIVGVTLAYMGITFYLLPRLGYGQPMPRLAYWQPYIYATGQMMHILGLAWSGGYGVQRKTAGAAQGLDQLPEIIGMGMMGFGGLISVIGGIMFLIVCLSAIFGKREKPLD